MSTPDELIQSTLDSSRSHAADLLEAAEFIRGMLTKQPLDETLEHYECLAARLLARGDYIQRNIGSLL